jgi:hypothetical protein
LETDRPQSGQLNRFGFVSSIVRQRRKNGIIATGV